MNRSIVRQIIGCILLVTCGAAAQDNCPHDELQFHDVRFEFEDTIDCGGGTSGFKVNGIEVSLTGQPTVCPRFVVIYPAHSTPKKKSQTSGDSGMFARLDGPVDVLTVFMRCHEYWLLGLLPIVVSENCAIDRIAKTGKLSNYVLVSCYERDQGSDR